MEGGVIKQISETARETVNRVLNTIDAFRPKVIFKKPLTELRIFKGEAIVSGEGIEGIIERIQSRISSVLESAGQQEREPIYFENEAQGQFLAKKYIKGGKGVHY